MMNFEGCTFQGLNLEADRSESTFVDCSFNGEVDFTFASLTNSKIVNCRFENCQISIFLGKALQSDEFSFDQLVMTGNTLVNCTLDAGYLTADFSEASERSLRQWLHRIRGCNTFIRNR